MTNHYFISALRSLQEALCGYAKLHPDVATKLNLSELRNKDPTIERLLEGIAYISGEIHRITDDDFSEISEILLMQLAPELLQPVPSATIVQLFLKVLSLHRT